MDTGSISAGSISVVVPARNEETTIAQVVERSFQAYADLNRTGEVLVVNDGSSSLAKRSSGTLGTF